MFPVENLTIEIFDVNISGIVTDVNIEESITGDLYGSISVSDGINLLDMTIAPLTFINIKYKYINSEIEMPFYCDGVHNISIENNIRRYTIKIKSLNETVKSTTMLNEVYEGQSTDIIKKMYTTMFGEESLNIESECGSAGGKYICPNISSEKAIHTVLRNSHDINQTGFFIFQRLIDKGITILKSHADILKDRIEGITINNKHVTGKREKTVGTSTKFTVLEDNSSMLAKMKLGLFGMAIDQLDLTKTKLKQKHTAPTPSRMDTEYGGVVPVSMSPTQGNAITNSNMFDDGSLPLFILNLMIEKINAEKIRLFNVKLSVEDVVAIPLVGVGYSIKTEMGGNDLFNTRYVGWWVISNITHKLTRTSNGFRYTQDYILVREL